MNWFKQIAYKFLNSLSKIPTRIKNGYLQFFDASKGIWGWVHRKVASIVYGKIPKGYEVHHKNREKLDNNPDNLQVLSKEEHRKIHANESLNRIIDAEKNRINYFYNQFNSSSYSQSCCPRCDGSGYLPHFNHVANGVCFLCNGDGDVNQSNFDELDLDNHFNEDDWNRDDYNKFDDYYNEEYDLDRQRDEEDYERQRYEDDLDRQRDEEDYERQRHEDDLDRQRDEEDYERQRYEDDFQDDGEYDDGGYDDRGYDDGGYDDGGYDDGGYDDGGYDDGGYDDRY